MPTPKVVARLWEQWRIIATPIVHAEYEGVRITPNVYTTLEEMDTFAGAMEEICAKSGRCRLKAQDSGLKQELSEPESRDWDLKALP